MMEPQPAHALSTAKPPSCYAWSKCLSRTDSNRPNRRRAFHKTNKIKQLGEELFVATNYACAKPVGQVRARIAKKISSVECRPWSRAVCCATRLWLAEIKKCPLKPRSHKRTKPFKAVPPKVKINPAGRVFFAVGLDWWSACWMELDNIIELWEFVIGKKCA